MLDELSTDYTAEESQQPPTLDEVSWLQAA